MPYGRWCPPPTHTRQEQDTGEYGATGVNPNIRTDFHAAMRIITERLELREYIPEDLPALVAYQSDPRTREFYGPDEGGAELLPGLLQTFLEWAEEVPRRNWQLAVTLSGEPRRVVGSCGLRSAGCEPGCADFGLDLSPDLWGRGYATEAARAMIEFGFGSLRLDCIRGQTVSGNTRVTALVRKLGFQVRSEHPGPLWMSERGWTYVEWQLTAGSEDEPPSYTGDAGSHEQQCDHGGPAFAGSKPGSLPVRPPT